MPCSRDTDVLTWWGHTAHDQVDDAVVERVHAAVLGGMGLLALHSAHYSKIFQRLLGTSCSLRWRNDGERELVWTVDPAHPIAAGVPHPIVIDAHEMYGEHFDIPPPDELVFVSSFAGGEVFRGGCCFRRGAGRIFYFSPGDQDYPIYHHPDVQRVHRQRRRVGRAGSRRPARRSRQPDGAARLVRMSAPLRVGVVGLGWAGQQHLAAYHAHPDDASSSRSPASRTARAPSSPRKYGIEHAVARLEGPAEGRGPRRGQRLRPDLPARPDRDRRAEARPPRALREADRARRARGRTRWCRAARKADRVLDVAFNHRQRGDIQKLKALIDEGRLGRPYYAKAWWLRRTGIPTVGSWFTRRELAGGGPLVDIGVHVLDWSLFLLGDPQVVAVSASTYDLLATNGFGAGSSGGYKGKTGAGDDETPTFDVEDLASVFMRLDGRRHAARRGQLGRAPPRRRRVRHHALRHRRRRRADRRRLRAEGRAAALHRRRRQAVASRVPVKRGRAHTAVIEQFVDEDPRRATGAATTGRAPPPSPASSTPATCQPPSSARSGSIPDATAPAARGWVSGGAAPVASRRRPPRGRRSPSSRRRRTSPPPR